LIELKIGVDPLLGWRKAASLPAPLLNAPPGLIVSPFLGKEEDHDDNQPDGC
jgi:hypothetical protein